jgi:quercetin dioxygenase-like cupin family protein
MTSIVTSWNSVPFQKTPAGLKEKSVELEDRVMRLVEFPAGWREPEMCRRGHLGYVMTGTMELRVGGHNVRLKPGDAIAIPEGTSHLAVTGTQSCLALIYQRKGENPPPSTATSL